MIDRTLRSVGLHTECITLGARVWWLKRVRCNADCVTWKLNQPANKIPRESVKNEGESEGWPRATLRIKRGNWLRVRGRKARDRINNSRYAITITLRLSFEIYAAVFMEYLSTSISAILLARRSTPKRWREKWLPLVYVGTEFEYPMHWKYESESAKMDTRKALSVVERLIFWRRNLFFFLFFFRLYSISRFEKFRNRFIGMEVRIEIGLETDFLEFSKMFEGAEIVPYCRRSYVIDESVKLAKHESILYSFQIYSKVHCCSEVWNTIF